MRTLAALLVGTTVLALAGCDPNTPSAGGQTGGEGIGCLPIASAPLGANDPSPIGFSGADVIALAGGQHDGTLTWAKDGTTSALTVDVALDANQVTFLDREWKQGGSGAANAEMAGDCPDVVQVKGTLSLTTADGAFDESWPVEVLADTKDSASSFLQLQLDALHGSYQVTEIDPASVEEVRAFLDVDFAPAAVHGKVFGDGSKCEAGGPEAACSSQNFDVASF